MEGKRKSFIKRIIPLIGIFIGLLTFFAWMISTYLFITGSTFTRTILIILLVYQYTFAKKSDLYLDFVRFLNPFGYFDHVELILEEPLKESKSIFSHHPHGILAYGFSMSSAFNKTLYNAFHCGSRGMLNLPISGIFSRWMGLYGVNKNSFQELMKKGKNIKFLPGGFEEATLSHNEKERVYINERKGFIKYSLQFGYTIYPCYSFNENKIYSTITYFEKFRLWLNKFKLPGTIFYGGKFFIFPRYDLEIVTVIGKAIDFPLIEKPTIEEVNKYHQIYVESLKSLYDRYKEKYGITSELEIL